MQKRLNFQILYLVLFAGIFYCCKGQNMKNEEDFTRLREKMVEQQIKNRGIRAPNVLEAFMNVPRHIFVPQEYRDYSYNDNPLPIGFDQTISQPYIVAYMTEILKPDKSMRVLEIGTGSGYQAAILSCLCKEVYSIEIIDSLAIRSKKIFEKEGYKNIHVKIGDGYKGWKEYAPFDAIIVTCAPAKIPEALLEQLAEGGRMIIPAGENYNQKLYLVEKNNDKLRHKETLPVLFVPMKHGNDLK
jgi:protein-L-isoaspartate(D-aspartate) O-methyltransferase